MMDNYNFSKHIGKFSSYFLWVAHIVLLCCPFLHCREDVEFGAISCNNSGITVEINLGDKFKGIIYSRGHFFNPSCSFPSIEPITQHATFSLPLMDCGTIIREVNGSLQVSNTVIVQKRRYVETSLDFEHNITCQLSSNAHLDMTDFWPAENITHTYIDEKLESWMDVKLGSDILGSELPKKLFIGDKFLLVIHLKDGGIHKDLRVDSCWAYDDDNFDDSRYALHLYERSSCETLEWLSAFKLTKGVLNTSDSLTYATVQAFKFPTSNKVHIACSVRVCKYSCPDYCNDLESEKSVVKSRSKRSDSDSPSDDSFRRRYKLMKATVKALGSKLIEKNKAQRAENQSQLSDNRANRAKSQLSDNRANRAEDSTVRRRISNTLSPETTEAILFETEDSNSLNNSQFGDLSNSSKDYESETDLFSNDVYVFNLTYTIVVFKGEEFDFKQNQEFKDFGYCVINVKYIVLLGSICFITFCLFVTCMGMVLYLRKEKKRHKIDEFLLYQYF